MKLTWFKMFKKIMYGCNCNIERKSCKWAMKLELCNECTQCRNPTLAKCEDETHTPKVGDLESSGTPECLEFDSKGQNTSDWGVLGVIGKILKCRCPKWPCIGHLDICSPSYGQKKGRESNWQFDSRPLKVGNRPLPDVSRWSAMGRWKALKESYNFGLDLTPIGGWS
jgi:hypothetical protein